MSPELERSTTLERNPFSAVATASIAVVSPQLETSSPTETVSLSAGTAISRIVTSAKSQASLMIEPALTSEVSGGSTRTPMSNSKFTVALEEM